MRLFSTISSERGKEVTKSGNEYIIITLTNERRQKFDIKFTGESVEVMSYYNGKNNIINYIKCDSCNYVSIGNNTYKCKECGNIEHD